MQLNIGICLLLGDELNLLVMLTDWDMVEEELGRESTSLTEEDTKAELNCQTGAISTTHSICSSLIFDRHLPI